MIHKITSVRFFVDKNQHTVTCKLAGFITTENADWTFNVKNSSLDQKFWVSRDHYDKTHIRNTAVFLTTQTTRCLDSDYNEDWVKTGKSIAYKKCLKKMYYEILKYHHAVHRAFEKEVSDSWERYGEKWEEAILAYKRAAKL